jgi:hypothetical protein
MSRITSLIVVCVVLCPVAYGATWYVDVDNISGTEDGESRCSVSEEAVQRGRRK